MKEGNGKFRSAGNTPSVGLDRPRRNTFATGEKRGKVELLWTSMNSPCKHPPDALPLSVSPLSITISRGHADGARSVG